jgi:beta-phosphoglucomutase-like phosphatase (HAD superfamily)
MTKIKAVVFDMDGVLIDAKEWHYEALNRALGLLGYSISRYDHLSRYDGLPTRRKLEMLTREKGLPKPLHGFLNELKQIYTMELIYSQCKPVFCHEYALAKLKGQGLKIGVASNSIRRTVEVMMERSSLARYMDVVLSNEDVRAAKPDPEIYLTAIARLGVEPAECLVVEDNEQGIRAAEAAGARLMVVDDIMDVNFDNIVRAIGQAEAKSGAKAEAVKS